MFPGDFLVKFSTKIFSWYKIHLKLIILLFYNKHKIIFSFHVFLRLKDLSIKQMCPKFLELKNKFN